MKVMISAPVRQDARIFKHYMRSLDALETGDHDIQYFFMLHNSPDIKNFLHESQYIEYQSNSEYKKTEHTHNWSGANLSEVANMKNYLLNHFLKSDCDYFLLVDSDLILHPKTLVHLIDQKKDIIGNVFWTKWESDREPMPNAWYYDYYGFETLEQIKRLHKKQVTKIGYTGACVLIHRKVIESCVNYSPIYNVSFTNWEDRAFCIRSAVQGYEIWLSTHYPATHLYRESEVINYESKSHL